jgi:hypothetical protein
LPACHADALVKRVSAGRLPVERQRLVRDRLQGKRKACAKKDAADATSEAKSGEKSDTKADAGTEAKSESKDRSEDRIQKLDSVDVIGQRDAPASN